MEWARGFHLPGSDGEARAMIVFDDGTGPALYVGGRFTTVGESDAKNVVKLDGEAWQPVGEGLRVMRVFGVVSRHVA